MAKSTDIKVAGICFKSPIRLAVAAAYTSEGMLLKPRRVCLPFRSAKLFFLGTFSTVFDLDIFFLTKADRSTTCQQLVNNLLTTY